MARHKDEIWNLSAGQRQPSGQRVVDWNTIKVALLMDLRDELKELNRQVGHHGSLLRELRGLRRDFKKLRSDIGNDGDGKGKR